MSNHDDRISSATWRRHLVDAALVLFVVALGVKAAWGIRSVRDLDASDESSYLRTAIKVGERGLPGVEGSPIYIAWDRLLLECGVATEDVPLISWSILAALLPASVFLLVRTIGGGPLAALVAGGLLPATTLIDVYPYPMHLAAVVLALGTALAACMKETATAAAVLGITLLAATYTRPEFLYALYVYVPMALAGAGALFWLRPESRRSLLTALLLLAVGLGVLVWALGSPKGTGARAIVAFGQHYAVNRYLDGARTDNPWHQWEQYLHDDFGEVHSVGEAWRANRVCFLNHMAANARTLPGHLRNTIAPRVDLQLLRHWYLFPQPSWSKRHRSTEGIAKAAMLAAGVLGWIGAGVGVSRGRRGSESSRGLLIAAAMLGFVAVPALAASLIIAPRLHYLIPTIVFLTALSAAGFRHLRPRDWFRGRTGYAAAIVFVAAGLAAVVPNRAHGWCVQSCLGRGENGRAILEVTMMERTSVRTLRGLNLRPPVTFLDGGHSLGMYSGLGTVTLQPAWMTPGESFLEFVDRLKIGIVVLESFLAEYPQLKDDAEFQSLFAGNETARFRLVSVEGFPVRRFAVRRDLRLKPAE